MAKTDAAFKAGRTTPRPVGYTEGNTVYGHYKVATVTGATVSLTANDPIVSFRWTSNVANAILQRIIVTGNITSDITTACNFDLQAVVARSFTASDSAGTAITVAATNKARSSMGATLVGDFRIATTGKLTAGTRTLDNYAFGQVNVPMAPTVTNLGSASLPIDLYNASNSSAHPILLAANEGFIIRNLVAGNTSGGVRYTFTFEWAEVPAKDDF